MQHLATLLRDGARAQAGSLRPHENTTMLAGFRKILNEGALTPLYQPIVDLRSGAVFGYEA